MQDYSVPTRKHRREWNNIFQRAMELRIQSRVTYPANLSFTINEKDKTFDYKEAFEIFSERKRLKKRYKGIFGR